MGFNPGGALYAQSFGVRYENVEVPTIQTRAPATTDVNYPIGKRWVDKTNNAEYCLTSLSSVGGILSATWVATGGGSVELSTLTGDTGTATPSGGNIKLAGTANQITTTASAAQVVVSLPSAIVAPGSITATTTLTATLGNITATNGNIVRGTAGNKDVYTSVATTVTAGANSAGTVTLVAGTATIATTAVTANSIIRLYRQGIGTTGAAVLGILTIGTKTAGVSFVINSVQPGDATGVQSSDVSVVAWEIVN